MMTRKDYVKTASLLSVWINKFPDVDTEQARFVVNGFADMFESDNPRFDRKRFKEAIYEVPSA